jgi:hypothetical protein
MSQFATKFTIAVLALFVLLSMSAFAQTKSTDINLLPKAAKPSKGSSSGSANYTTHRFEVSFQGGASVGGSVGRPDFGTCKELASGGCDMNLPVGHRGPGGGGVYPGRMGGLRPFQTSGGVVPGNGNLLGIRIGVNVTPNWQVEGIWNHSRSDVAFTNELQFRQAVEGFTSAGFGTGQLEVVNDGKPQGDQNMFLFNLNRNFNPGGRVQPYAGFGLGGESWSGNPNALIFLRGISRSPSGDALFAEHAGAGTGFAWDFAAGARMYLTEHFGVRADFMNVMSYPNLTNRSTTIDLSGFSGVAPGTVVPLSNTREQSGRFNQMLFTGGVFWAFGGAMEAPHNSAASGDRDSMHDRWEISLNFGAVHGVNTGKSNVKCVGATVATATDGCDLNQPLTTDSNLGVFPTKAAGNLSSFLAHGGINPGDGWTGGLRLGFNLTPNWQINFQWNADGTGTRFDNQELLQSAVASFYSSGNGAGNRSLVLGRSGTAQGNQSLYLFNVDYSFSPQNRLVPYIGAGIGGENWFAGPNANLTTDLTQGGGGIANFSKISGSNTGFAFNLEAGLKYYLGRHWGVRTDFQDVISHNDFTHRFQTTDVSDFLGFGANSVVPVSGTLKQSSTFNQIRGTAGFFLTF